MGFSRWRRAVVGDKQKYVWQVGVLLFGVPFGLVSSLWLLFLTSEELANHPLWHKIAIVAVVTLLFGPVTGWFWGQITWVLKPVWNRTQLRLDDHERRIQALESLGSEPGPDKSQ